MYSIKKLGMSDSVILVIFFALDVRRCNIV